MKVNPKIDLVFKKLFGSEENTDILMSLINSILPENEQISELILLNPYNVSDYSQGKLSILDIRAKDKNGVQYDIEMQIRGYEFYGRRTLYYWAKMYGTQLDYLQKEKNSENNEDSQADETIESDYKLSKATSYSELKKCIVISLVDFNFFKDDRYQRYFTLKDAETNDTHTDLDYLNLYFIELKKFKGKLEPTRTTLERWINFLNNAYKYSNDKLPQELAEVKEIRKASLSLDTMYLNEKERMDYEAQQKFYLDEESRIKDAVIKAEKKGMEKGIKEGMKKGIKEGIKDGIEKGKKSEKTEVAKKLKKLGISIENIVESTGLSVEEIKKL